MNKQVVLQRGFGIQPRAVYSEISEFRKSDGEKKSLGEINEVRFVTDLSESVSSKYQCTSN